MKKHTKINISPEQYAIDCIDVTTCLHRYPNFKKSKITGPDTTSGWKLSFLKRFINTLNQLNQTVSTARTKNLSTRLKNYFERYLHTVIDLYDL